ncbi:MAG: DUF4397 domain-containing protein [Halolamina sp.]|uniref:DUF4397 domain-containing protein n=1 Tax=Halolamina sp. TaxID=1940283 RepID=UPI002FC3284D
MPTKLNRRKVLFGIGAATAATTAGVANVFTADRAIAATGDDTPARLRAVHVSPDAPAVDVLVDGEPAFTNVPFRTVSEYSSLTPDTYLVTIRAAGDPDTVVFEGEVSLEAGTDYTVAALGELAEDSFDIEVLTDRNRKLPDAVAELRVVHASPDAPAVDVVTEHDRHIAEDLSFGQVGHYGVFFAGETELAIRPSAVDEGSADPVFETSLPLKGGKTYTVFAAGYLTPDDEPTDEPFGLLPSVGSPRPKTARVRGVHASPDAPNVDIFLDDEKAFSTVHFGDVTEYRSLTGGTYSVVVTAAGDRDTVAFESEVTLEAGRDYTLAAIGELSEETIRPAVLVDDADVDPGHAGVRVLHASPDAPAVDVTTAGSETTLVDDLSFGDATGVGSLDPGRYTLEVKPESRDDDNPFDAEFDVELAAGQLYTLVATGYFTADDEPAKTKFTLVPAVTERRK